MDELFREVEAEKEHILATLQALKEALERKEKTVVELAAIATFLQNAYNGIENVGYGIMLDEEKLIPLAEKLPDLWKDFESELEAFLNSLGGK